MKKEFIIAILIGLTMGLFITYGYYYSQKTEEKTQTAATIDKLEQTEPKESQESNGRTTVFLPTDESVIKEKSTTVTGKAAPGVFVIIYVNDQPIITQADETGNFSKEVQLQNFANIIHIHVIDKLGEHEVIKRTVIVYDQEYMPVSEEEESETEEAEVDDETETETETETN